MSDQKQRGRIMEMSAIELLQYIVDHPFYLTDSYYGAIGGTIRNRLAALTLTTQRKNDEISA